MLIVVHCLHFIDATFPSFAFIFDNLGRFGSSTEEARFVGPIGQGLAAYRSMVAAIVDLPNKTEVAITWTLG